MWRDTTITHKNIIQNERREKFLRGNRSTNITTHTDRAGAFGFCAFQQQCIWFNASMQRANPWKRCALYHTCPRARSLFVSGSDDISPKRLQQQRLRLLLFRTQKLSVPFCLELTVQLWHTYRPEICGHCLWFPWASVRPDGWTVVGVPGWKDDGQRKLGAYWERHTRQKQGKRTTPTIPSTVYPPACSSMHGDIHTHSRHTHACMQNHLQAKPNVQTNNIFAAQALDKEKWRNEETINPFSSHMLWFFAPPMPERCTSPISAPHNMKQGNPQKTIRLFNNEIAGNKNREKERKNNAFEHDFKKWTRNSRREWTQR